MYEKFKDGQIKYPNELARILTEELTIHFADSFEKYLELALEKNYDREFLKDQMLNRGVNSKTILFEPKI
jgi:hypothetical protein